MLLIIETVSILPWLYYKHLIIFTYHLILRKWCLFHLLPCDFISFIVYHVILVFICNMMLNVCFLCWEISLIRNVIYPHPCVWMCLFVFVSSILLRKILKFQFYSHDKPFKVWHNGISLFSWSFFLSLRTKRKIIFFSFFPLSKQHKGEYSHHFAIFHLLSPSPSLVLSTVSYQI